MTVGVAEGALENEEFGEVAVEIITGGVIGADQNGRVCPDVVGWDGGDGKRNGKVYTVGVGRV